MLKLNHQKAYRKFVHGRDEALETLLRNSRLRQSELTSECFTRVLQVIQSKYGGIMQTGSRLSLQQLEAQIEQYFDHLAWNLWMEVSDLRKKAYMLSYSGEVQAVVGITGKPPKISLSKTRLDEFTMKKFNKGIMPMKSFNLALSKVRRNVISALEYSFAFGDEPSKALGRVFMKLPKRMALPRKKVLKTVKIEEARRPKFSGENDSAEVNPFGRGAFGFEFDDETWQHVIDDLASDHVFTNRSPEAFMDITNPFSDQPIRDNIPEEDKVYHWEVEQDVVNDFVEQVRSGQVEAAQKNGINDFVWIAILDDRTDACCEWRSGLLTSEIEARLKSDKSGDDCRATVPPAHFNCRCTLAPASSELQAEDISGTEKEFDEWLNQ